MIKWCCQVPKRFSKRKLQVVNTKTNRPIHPQPTSSETYNPYAVLVPFTSVFLLELTVNTRRKRKKRPKTLVAILNLRARSRGHASTNQTFFASEERQRLSLSEEKISVILRAHSNLTCGKNIGNASNGSSQHIMSVVFRKENYFAPLDPVYKYAKKLL